MMKRLSILVLILFILQTFAFGAVTDINDNYALSGSLNYGADTGSANTYAISVGSISAYATGTCYQFKAANANTGASTLNVNSIGAKTIKRLVGGITNDLIANDIVVGQIVQVCYDGTNLQMASPLQNATGGGGGGGVACSDLPTFTGEVTSPGASCVLTAYRLLSTSGTKYLKWDKIGGDDSTESINVGTQINVGATGSKRILCVALGTAPGGGNSRVFTGRVNGVDSTAVVTISGASTKGCDTHTVAQTQNDLLSVKSTVTGTPPTTSIAWQWIGGDYIIGGSGTTNVVEKWGVGGVTSIDSSRTDDGTTVFETLPEDWLTHAAPSTPASGHAAVYVDSTSKNLTCKNDAGVITHGVKTKASVANNFLTSIADDGSVGALQPVCASLSDSSSGCTATINSGTTHQLAYYSGTTAISSEASPGAAGTYVKSNGTDWATSSGSASGTGSCTNQVVTATNSDAAPTCSTIGGSVMAANQTIRVAQMNVGADNATLALADADIGPQGRQVFVPYAATLVEVDVAADAGTPSVIVRKNCAGTQTDLLSSALATAGSGGIACSKTTSATSLDGATTCTNTLQNTSIAAGCWLELKSGTAGGTAKRMSIAVMYTMN